MEVIFIKDLKNQGKKGEIKEVKDGYAKNFLIKNGYAVMKNETSLKELKRNLNNEKKLDEENRIKANKLKESLEKETYKFKVKTGTSDKVFGSVSIKQIKEKLDEKYDISKNQIMLDSPLTSLGYHKVCINLYKDINAIINIELTK
ncbi:MAG: 50S ribosomal protein L9 [Bacilli bacterium]|nr:50S ribosomal protein L9 [Mycoplasmatota bacterium]MDY4237274.1 50S ribosomal protein L9 [Bacilli bacterium]